jgi:chorismate mutase
MGPKEMFSWTPWKYFPGFERRMDQRRKCVPDVALVANDAALPGSQPSREERSIQRLSRAESFAEESLWSGCKTLNTRAERHNSQHPPPPNST